MVLNLNYKQYFGVIREMTQSQTQLFKERLKIFCLYSFKQTKALG